MTSREHVKELARRLEKAISKIDIQKVLNILDSLSEIETISISLLQETKLGKTVNKIKKQESFKSAENVRISADKLVKKWKNQVSKEKDLKNGHKNGHKKLKLKKTSKTKSQPQQTSNNNEHNEKDEEMTSNNNNNNNGYKREPYDWETGDNRRDKMISKFISVLKPNNDNESYLHYEKLSAEIESNLGEEYGSNTTEYIQKYRDLHFNIKKTKELKEKILNGSIPISKLIKMSAEELASKDLQEKREKDRKWAMEEARNDHALDEAQAMTDEYKCGKCKQRKCKYSQAQTRSADEPMTTFVTCLVCGNRWRF